MTAKKTASTENPFDESEASGLTLGDDVGETKEAAPELTPTENFAETNPEETKDEKPKETSAPSRRTRAEKLADDIAAARTLLSDNGFNVSEQAGEEGEITETVEVVDEDFSDLDFDKLPLSAQSGNIVGSVDLNQGAVPTLNISLQNWIGAPIIAIAASQAGDVEAVLKQLKKQAKKAKHG